MQIDIMKASKSFGSIKVLNEISLKVFSGEILCLLGPSGAGKTTLIRLITGAINLDSGSIKVDDIKVPSISLYKYMGYMPQSDALYYDISGQDNLLFFGGLYNIKGKVLKDRVNTILKSLDLYKDKDRLVSTYSGGMRKRLSLAVALLHNPKYLLLDEPTAGIDPVLRKSIWDYFYRLRDQGVAIVVTTHIIDEALKCDHVALIYNGKLIFNDTTKNVIEKTPNGDIEQLFFMSEDKQL
ncbi:MAG: ABC transporter ATP-binding protein [Eubacteriales bacterium]